MDPLHLRNGQLRRDRLALPLHPGVPARVLNEPNCATTRLAASLVAALTGALLPAQDLWDLAQRSRHIHRFSTLFTAQDVRDRLSSEAGIDAAIDWAKRTGVTKVYVETYRDAYQASRDALSHASRRFREANLEVSGCVTTTRIGKRSTGWQPISCYTARETQQQVRSIFEFAASLFDEVMIDDFWFTDCTCTDCEAARAARQVKILDAVYPSPGDSWADYRSELMVRLSRDLVLAAGRRVNPNVRFIIKYPQWYDRFHERGYDVLRQTADFDRIWVGTETRDRDGKGSPGGVPQYEAFFIMRWLGAIGGAKTGGGWYDPLNTTPKTYLEQARQTVLGGARESLLFCYGALQRNTGPANIEALRPALKDLIDTAAQVARRRPAGIAAYKPPNSHPENEQFVFDNVGMLGLPLLPTHQFPAKARAAFFSLHALKDPQLVPQLAALIRKNRPVLLTDGLAERLSGKLPLDRPNVLILPVRGKPRSLLDLPQSELDPLRARLLKPFRADLRAPAEVALYLFEDSSFVLHNFRNEDVTVNWKGAPLTIPARGWHQQWR